MVDFKIFSYGNFGFERNRKNKKIYSEVWAKRANIIKFDHNRFIRFGMNGR